MSCTIQKNKKKLPVSTRKCRLYAMYAEWNGRTWTHVWGPVGAWAKRRAASCWSAESTWRLVTYTPKLYRARVRVRAQWGARSRPEHRYSPLHGREAYANRLDFCPDGFPCRCEKWRVRAAVSVPTHFCRATRASVRERAVLFFTGHQSIPW